MCRLSYWRSFEQPDPIHVKMKKYQSVVLTVSLCCLDCLAAFVLPVCTVRLNCLFLLESAHVLAVCPRLRQAIV